MANERRSEAPSPRELQHSRERLGAPEQQGAQKQVETRVQLQADSAERQVFALPAATPIAPSAASQEPVIVDVEKVLSEDLGDAYATMDPVTQREFKERGEETARQIVSLLQQAKVQVRKIIRLITGWMKMIPGISKLFIEQEAKIKTDRLLAMRRKMRGEQRKITES